jgi:hypothetical protein
MIGLLWKATAQPMTAVVPMEAGSAGRSTRVRCLCWLNNCVALCPGQVISHFSPSQPLQALAQQLGCWQPPREFESNLRGRRGVAPRVRVSDLHQASCHVLKASGCQGGGPGRLSPARGPSHLVFHQDSVELHHSAILVPVNRGILSTHADR